MIIIAVFGGLGNQMFQYAFARALELEKGGEVKLDTTLINDRTPRLNFTYRKFQLDLFFTKIEIASKKEVHKFVPNLWANTPKIYKQLYALKRKFFNRFLYIEKCPYTFEVDFSSLNDNTYMIGYYQSEKYFAKYRSEILKDFRLKFDLSQESKVILKMISKIENTCSIHIRRGDYLNNQINKVHGLCDMNYYRKAIELVENKLSNVVFIIFSDDPEWVKMHFSDSLRFMIVDKVQNRQDAEDLFLMSKCEHQIIANSSFSWWGAWLNENEFKIVIAPSHWLRTPADNLTVKDLIPESWIVI